MKQILLVDDEHSFLPIMDIALSKHFETYTTTGVREATEFTQISIFLLQAPRMRYVLFLLSLCEQQQFVLQSASLNRVVVLIGGKIL